MRVPRNWLTYCIRLFLDMKYGFCPVFVLFGVFKESRVPSDFESVFSDL